MKTTNPAESLRALTVGVCHNCAGLGVLSHFGHVASGVCFLCNGDGFHLYADRSIRFADIADRSRAVRLETIRQAIACFAYVTAGEHADDFLMRNRRRARLFLLRTVRENAATLGPVVWDRAYAAVHAVYPLKADAVAALRVKTFPAVAA